jgi:hypothetical protein
MNNLQRIIWLASFPKSGNTWVRIFLANYFQPPGRTLGINELHKFTTADVRQDFFDKANGRPFRGKTLEDWLKVRPKALRLIAASKPEHHFVKTHCQATKLGRQDLIPPEVTAAAIYILRNPFDLAGSYARHLDADPEAAIGLMLDSLGAPRTETNIVEMIGRWDSHVASWVEAPGLPLHVMRYEDMIAGPGEAFRRLFAFLRVPVDEAQFARTLAGTSFSALQTQERQKGFKERPPKMQRFFAKGRVGGWREELTPGQVARIRLEFLPVLEKWYPELLDETREFAKGASGDVSGGA